MPKRKEYSRIYYIVFTKLPRLRWWQFFVSKEINHCYVITAVTEDTSIVINQTERGTVIEGYDKSVEDLVINANHPHNQIVWQKVKLSDFKKNRVAISRTCIGMTKDMLGIRKPFIITAQQLFNYLIRGK